ncbi:MAG: AIR synthase-related protein, partial [Clostridiales bacterium]
ELTQASGLQAELWAAAVPLWPEAVALAENDIVPGGAYRNANYLQDKVDFAAGIEQAVRTLLFDPQTSGGMLMAISKDKAAALEGRLEAAGVDYAIIGVLRPGTGIRVRLQ